MLKINKTINLNGTSEIDNQVVVYMSASISTDGNSNANINKSIANQDLYNANKSAVRADMAEFEDEVYKVEDSLATGSTVEYTPEGIKVEVKSLKEKVGK